MVRVTTAHLACIMLWWGVTVPVASSEEKAYIVQFKTERASSGPQALMAMSHRLSSKGSLRSLPLDNSVVAKLSGEELAELSSNPEVASIEVDGTVKATFLPNDALFSNQYGLNSTHGIFAPAAWDRTKGSTNKLVAVIDSGIDFNHDDLSENIWSNPAEIPENGLDDDANGFVDDYQGYDFAELDNSPSDTNGHGTHVSGIIAASGNNVTGVIGVAWQTNIIPVKCLGDDGEGKLSYLIAALDYVSTLKDQGHPISVVNMSLGTEVQSAALERAVSRAASRGLLLVAAAGNDYGRNNDKVPSYPANINLPNVISVTATNSSGELAAFSNVGPNTVDIAAPGEGILSTWLTSSGVEYAYINGTSMAAPFVSGVAALIAAANTDADASLIRSLILATAVPRSDLRGRIVTGGLLNARGAIVMATASRNLHRVSGTVRRGSQGIGRARVSLRFAGGVVYRRTTTTSVTGRYTFLRVPRGSYTISISRSGYTFIPKEKRVSVTFSRRIDFSARRAG